MCSNTPRSGQSVRGGRRGGDPKETSTLFKIKRTFKTFHFSDDIKARTSLLPACAELLRQCLNAAQVPLAYEVQKQTGIKRMCACVCALGGGAVADDGCPEGVEE